MDALLKAYDFEIRDSYGYGTIIYGLWTNLSSCKKVYYLVNIVVPCQSITNNKFYPIFFLHLNGPPPLRDYKALQVVSKEFKSHYQITLSSLS